MWADLRLAGRTLWKVPLFSLSIVTLLTIGIAANTLVFTVVNALLLRPLPVRAPERLVRPLTIRTPLPPHSEFAYEQYEGWRTVAAFEDVFAWSEHDLFVMAGDVTERARVHFVTENFFSSLGTTPRLGRLLTPDDQPQSSGTAPVVLSNAYWKRRFGGDLTVVGSTIAVNGHKALVVGVTPEGFNGLTVETDADLRAPLGWLRIIRPKLYQNRIFCEVAARVRPDFPMETARAQAEAVYRSTWEALNRSDPSLPGRFELEPIARGISRMRTQLGHVLLAVMGGVTLLLLLVCANVAGLLVARSAGRAGEFAVRMALGASRFRLARQVFCEALLLTAVSAIGGLGLTSSIAPLLVRVLPPVRDLRATKLPLTIDLAPDWRVLGFSMCVAAGTVLLFGLLPALSTTADTLHPLLREVRVVRNWRGRQVLVAVQVALATVFLVGAGLAIVSLQNLQTLDAGFNAERVITFTVDPEMVKYSPQQAAALQRRLLDEARALPETESAAIANRGLMRGTGRKMTVARSGEAAQKADFMNTSTQAITPGYFATMQIAWRAGRNLTPQDQDTTPTPVIVNRSFARRFGGESAVLGAMFGAVSMNGEPAEPMFQVVGIAGDAKYRSLREPFQPILYGLASADESFIVHIRTRRAPEAVLNPMRTALTRIDPRLSFVEVNTLQGEIATSLWPERAAAYVAALFSGAAILIVAAGLYAVVAFAVVQRRREIGIRMALGAEPRSIAASMFGRAALLGGAGAAAGLLVASLLGAKIRDLLYGVTPGDRSVFGVAGAVALLITIAATVIPAVRAARLDPASVLREE